jgi:hypothetical protein
MIFELVDVVHVKPTTTSVLSVCETETIEEAAKVFQRRSFYPSSGVQHIGTRYIRTRDTNELKEYGPLLDPTNPADGTYLDHVRGRVDRAIVGRDTPDTPLEGVFAKSIDDEILRCERTGFTESEAVRYCLCCEEANPKLEESVALARMKAIEDKVFARTGKRLYSKAIGTPENPAPVD